MPSARFDASLAGCSHCCSCRQHQGRLRDGMKWKEMQPKASHGSQGGKSWSGRKFRGMSDGAGKLLRRPLCSQHLSFQATREIGSLPRDKAHRPQGDGLLSPHMGLASPLPSSWARRAESRVREGEWPQCGSAPTLTPAALA